MAGKWMPIESAPKDCTRVIVAWGLNEFDFAAVGEALFIPLLGQWHRPMNCGVVIHPHHWMPLPEPPESATQPLPPPNEE